MKRIASIVVLLAAAGLPSAMAQPPPPPAPPAGAASPPQTTQAGQPQNFANYAAFYQALAYQQLYMSYYTAYALQANAAATAQQSSGADGGVPNNSASNVADAAPPPGPPEYTPPVVVSPSELGDGGRMVVGTPVTANDAGANANGEAVTPAVATTPPAPPPPPPTQPGGGMQTEQPLTSSTSLSETANSGNGYSPFEQEPARAPGSPAVLPSGEPEVVGEAEARFGAQSVIREPNRHPGLDIAMSGLFVAAVGIAIGIIVGKLNRRRAHL